MTSVQQEAVVRSVISVVDMQVLVPPPASPSYPLQNTHYQPQSPAKIAHRTEHVMLHAGHLSNARPYQVAQNKSARELRLAIHAPSPGWKVIE